MHKGLLVWNIILTVLTVLLVAGILVQNNFISLNSERIRITDENFAGINEVVKEHAVVIGEHAKVINENAELMNEEYLAAIEANQMVMDEMAELVTEYQEVINWNAIYFEEILGNLEDLSLIVTQ